MTQRLMRLFFTFAGVDGRLSCENEVHLTESHTKSASVLQILKVFFFF